MKTAISQNAPNAKIQPFAKPVIKTVLIISKVVIVFSVMYQKISSFQTEAVKIVH